MWCTTDMSKWSLGANVIQIPVLWFAQRTSCAATVVWSPFPFMLELLRISLGVGGDVFFRFGMRRRHRALRRIRDQRAWLNSWHGPSVYAVAQRMHLTHICTRIRVLPAEVLQNHEDRSLHLVVVEHVCHCDVRQFASTFWEFHSPSVSIQSHMTKTCSTIFCGA